MFVIYRPRIVRVTTVTIDYDGSVIAEETILVEWVPVFG